MRRIAPRIVVDENVRFGRAVIEGTRVPVETVLGRLAADMSIEEICEEYDLAREDILAALSYAAGVLAAEQKKEENKYGLGGHNGYSSSTTDNS